MSDDFKDLKASFQWGVNLELTPEQREELQLLCARISGSVPRTALIAERRKRQAAEKRVEELEAQMPKRWWRF